MKTLCRLTIRFVLLAFLNPVSARPVVEDDYKLDVQRRLNAHGEEFMSAALTRDERQLIIATESGKLIVWGISERKVLKELDQGSAVHCVVSLSDSDTFIAAGGPHGGPTSRAVVRKWHIGSGTSEEIKGLNEGTVVSLSVDAEGKRVVAGAANGDVAIWNSADGSLIAKRSFKVPAIGLALRGRELFVTLFSPDKERLQNSILRTFIDEPDGRVNHLNEERIGGGWAGLGLSPNRQFLAAQLKTDIGSRVGLFDLSTEKEIGNFEGQDFAWTLNGELILFDSQVATARISIDKHAQVSRTELQKESSFHQSGAPSIMTGAVVSADASKAWEVFQLGATLVEIDLGKQTFERLYSISGLLYTMDVREGLNLIATGGDDGLVRVRKLSDLSMVKEFRVEPGVPQGVALLADGQHVVFSASSKDSPTRISIGNLVSGESRQLFDVSEPFVRVDAAAGGFIYGRDGKIVLAGETGATVREFEIEGALSDYAISTNGEWLVASDESGKLFRFEIKTGKRSKVSDQSVESLTRLAITSDGRFVYTTEFEAKLRRWDAKTGKMRVLAEIRGQAKTLELSRDEKEIAIGGNHRDVAIYDIASGKRRLYVEVSASDFYVTNAWLGGDRLLFSTDAGVLFDGLVRREPQTKSSNLKK